MPSATTTTRTGSTVVVRPVTPADREAIAGILDRMSPEALHMRFLGPFVRVPPSVLDALTSVDGVTHHAWIAEVDGEAAGTVRIVEGEDGAELAIELSDEHRGRGLGRLLSRFVLGEARALGIAEVTVVVHPENHVALALFRSLGARFRPRSGLLIGSLPVQAAIAQVA